MTRTVDLGAGPVEVTDVEFSPLVPEPFVEYRLSDGTYLKVKTVVTAVMRVEGQTDPQGNPALAVVTQNVVVSRPADG